METTSKSSDLLARLRSVTLEDELKLTNIWSSEKSNGETSVGSSFKSNTLTNYKPSWEDTNLTLRSTSYLESESKSDILPKLHPQQSEPKAVSAVDEFSTKSLSMSESIENRENPFAKMSRKGTNLTSKLSLKLHGWVMSTSCFGILGLVCGGSLAAWSLLTQSGSHSMTSLGFSLTISGLLMLVLVGIYQTVLHTSGQT